MEMKKKSVWTALITLGAFAATVNADNWCPTSTNFTITCSNCTKTLTCDYAGGIKITGSNVVLDGNGKALSGSSTHGIEVAGNGAYISNVEILWPVGHGIYYTNSGGTWTGVSNVDVYGADGDGLRTGVSHNMTISGSSFIESLGSGIFSDPNGSNYTDVNYSAMSQNMDDGLYSIQAYYQWHAYNAYADNDAEGARESQGEKGIYRNSAFDNNGDHGLVLDQLAGLEPLEIKDNTGYSNTNYDCYVSSVNGLVVSNNDWGTHESCVNIP